MMMSLELEQLRIAEEVACFGSFAWQLDDQVYLWSRGMYRLIDAPETEPASLELWLSRVPEEDHAMVREGFAEAVAEMRPYSREYRLVVNGEERWVRTIGAPQVMSTGKRVVIGVVLDITTQMHDRLVMEQLNRELMHALNRSQEVVESLARYREILGAD